jgi:hypothetical protein
MNTKYLMEYKYDNSSIVRFVIVEGYTDSTWRDLQQQHDPKYRLNSIKFYPLGVKLEYKQGD